ncbi:MAG: DNA-processing protein DprA [Gemmatimonadota bacterium]|jgi:DNA processing protein
MPRDSGSLRAILALKAAPGLGDTRLLALLESCGSAEAALAELRRRSPEAAAGLESRAVRDRIERAYRSVCDVPTSVFVIGEPRYPAFDGLVDPPPVLFARGDLSLLDRPSVAVVGSRRHTEYGADATRRIVTALAGAGVVVASGLAHGIDRIAHESALECGGATFAVIGSGIDVEYPTANARLQRRIARKGLVLSEFMPGDPALRHHFPKRNRLLAALTTAVVVVEAAGRSGSLITADHALDLGRDVLAVPGPIGRSTSEGTNRLIREGAAIVTTPEDVLEAIGILPAPASRDAIASGAGLGEPGRTVLSALGDGPRHVDDLSRSAGLDPAAVLGTLLELELAGLVRQFPGKRFGRAA